MAMNIAPEKIMPTLESIISQNLDSADEAQRAASFMAMAVVSEGCADHIMQRSASAPLFLLLCTVVTFYAFQVVEELVANRL